MDKSGSVCLLFLLILTISCFVQVASYNILFAVVFGSKSHKFALHPVAEELSRRGHNVTFMTAIKTNPIKGSNVREVFLERPAAAFQSRKFSFFMGTMADDFYIELLFDYICAYANATYAEPFVQELINKPSSHNYDVFVADALFNDFVLPIGQRLNIPIVYIAPSIVVPHISWLMKLPTSYSSNPSPFIFATGRISLAQKIQSIYNDLRYIYRMLHGLYPRIDAIVGQYLPNSASMSEIGSKVSFIMSNDHSSINHKIPRMPYYVEVGGLNLKPAARLPKDLENFMNSSGTAGTIYFSLGSVTTGESMPITVRDKLIEGFSRLDQKILWKCEIKLTNLPRNVQIIDWAPQSDLLAHQNLKVFITHGGGLSIQEAGYAGCPVLGIPLSADQTGNVANAVDAGFGEFIDWRDFTVDEFVRKIKMLIDDERYKKNAVRVATLLRDRPQHPTTTASYWIEYVIRHKGAPHLKSHADKLNFFQYYLLDVIGVLLVAALSIMLVVIFASYMIIKALINYSRVLASKKKQQQQQQKKKTTKQH